MFPIQKFNNDFRAGIICFTLIFISGSSFGMDEEPQAAQSHLEKLHNDCTVVILRSLDDESIKTLRQTSKTMRDKIDHVYQVNKITQPTNVFHWQKALPNKRWNRKVAKTVILTFKNVIAPSFIVFKNLVLGGPDFSIFLKASKNVR